MHTTIQISSPITRTPRVAQVEGIFDLDASLTSTRTWKVRLPIEERTWNIGLVVGPSGCGKSTVLRHLFPEAVAAQRTLTEWPEERSILDGFPASMPIKEVVRLLSAVGFSSPPAWLRPYRALSAGEQFRCNLARLLAANLEIVVVDEYSSVVDRTVARVGSAALEKAVRRRGQRLVTATCHEDVEAWLRPDWVYRPAEERFAWRLLQPRPAIELDVVRCRRDAWQLFRPHHYLNTSLAPGSVCFLATWDGRPAAFSAWIKSLTRSGGWREHRTVTLPDYQGVGIGHALADFCAAVWKGLGQRAATTTSHPAVIAARLVSPHWRLTRPPSLANRGERTNPRHRHARTRLTAGFEYVGPAWPTS